MTDHRFIEHLDIMLVPQSRCEHINPTGDRSVQVLLLFFQPFICSKLNAHTDTHTGAHKNTTGGVTGTAGGRCCVLECHDVTMTHFGREKDREGGRQGGEKGTCLNPLIAFVRSRSCDLLAFVRNHMHLEWG